MGMIYVLPDKLYTSQEVKQILGKDWACPFCKVVTTKIEGRTSSTWVYSPLRAREPKFICEGCATDIHVTCANEEYETASYRDLIEEIANRQNILPLIFRKMCLEHQVEILEGRLRRPCHPELETEFKSFKEFLEEILENL